MKKIILLVLITLFLSCNDSSSRESSKKEEKSEIERDYEIADMVLKLNSMKIGLLSIIKNVPQEKANAVLRDYLAKTFTSTLQTIKDPNYIVKVVDTIAQKNNLSKKLTASIIFGYRYEMITRDEIIDDYTDEMQDYQNEMEQY
ncbi:hypothetical protein [Algibacter mikhailovii]|uniref:Lipoprotein n=1 Tax=Algibacter mikhailovii TaxID=425498 RepID=A0A918QTE9_9FLAO|nr:hypothetical protein [Algibacter mikhailovii]GGZ72474.1 hypothetical protein GCM10007028_06870 [Algibacter mikhailovii]